MMENQILKARRSFYREMFEDHLDEVGILFEQRKELFKDPQTKWQVIINLETRLNAHFKVLDKGSNIARELVKEKITETIDYIISGAAYSLASMDIDDTDANNLDLVLNELDRADDEKSLWLTEALKHGKNPEIGSKISQRLEVSKEEIQVILLNILMYRKQGDLFAVQSLLKSKSEKVRSRAAITLAHLGDNSVEIELERQINKTESEDYEKIVFALLSLKSTKGLVYCRLHAYKQGSLTTKLPLLLAMAGNRRDHNQLGHILGLDDIETGPAAIGIHGFSAGVTKLLEQLQKDIDEERKIKISEAMEQITGAGLREKSSSKEETEQVCTDAKIWSNWWQSHQQTYRPDVRYRFGKPYSTDECIKILSDPNSSVFQRERNALELQIGDTGRIPLETDWMAKKQQEVIQKIR